MLLKEAGAQKPKLDCLNEVSSSLLELVPWRAREGLDRLVTDDNERYRAASDTLGQRVQQLDAAILKSQQVDDQRPQNKQRETNNTRKLRTRCCVGLEPDVIFNLYTSVCFRGRPLVSKVQMSGEDIVVSIFKYQSAPGH